MTCLIRSVRHSKYIIEDLTNSLIKDGDGSIPTQELGTAMRALGCFPNESDIVEMADMVEEINFDQFIQFLKR